MGWFSGGGASLTAGYRPAPLPGCDFMGRGFRWWRFADHRLEASIPAGCGLVRRRVWGGGGGGGGIWWGDMDV